MSSHNNSKVAIITGAGTGVGRSVAQRFLTEGYQVALLGRRQELLDETAAGAQNALVRPCDVSQPEAVENAFADVVKKWGRVDVLLNNFSFGLFFLLLVLAIALPFRVALITFSIPFSFLGTLMVFDIYDIKPKNNPQYIY